MRRSTDRILTTHVGALPAPQDVWARPDVAEERLVEAVAEVCDRQRQAGIDFINEGELTKGGHWMEYLRHAPAATSRPGIRARSGSCCCRAPTGSSSATSTSRSWRTARCSSSRRGPARAGRRRGDDPGRRGLGVRVAVHYRGQAALEREINVMKAALGDTPASDAFLTTTAPLSVEPGRDKGMYATDEEHVYAIAEAMQVEYEAIAAAGFQVQVDDAWLGALWDRIGIPMGIDGYRKYCQMRCEALNHALRNIPEEQIRYHLCWGSWHGPHSADLPLPDVVDIMLSIKAQPTDRGGERAPRARGGALGDTKLPDGKILGPVSSPTRRR